MDEEQAEQPQTPSASLLELANRHAIAKLAEKQAAQARIAIETEIIALTGFAKAEGSETFPYEGPDGRCKVVLKQPISRSLELDDAEYATLKKDIGGALVRRIVRNSYSLATAEARALQEQDPTTWAKVAKYLTSKPGKVSVDVAELIIAAAPDASKGA